MNRWILAVLLWLLMLGSANAAGVTDLNTRVYYIGGDEHFPPYEYVVQTEGSSAYRGFNVDIMKAVALETGLEIQFEPMTWSKALNALNSGELDLIQGMKYDIDRLDRYDFSREYLISAHAIFVLTESYISGLDDLKGRSIAVQEGDVAQNLLRDAGEYTLVAVPNPSDAFKLLLRGEVAAVVCNKLAGNYILQRTDRLAEVKLVGAELNPQRYCVAVRKGDQQLLASINYGLEQIKRNGTYDKIYQKWFGEQLDYPPAYYKGKLLVTATVLGALGIIVIMLGYVSYILRKKVEERTAEITAINRTLIEQSEYIRKENLYKESILNSSYNGIVTINKAGIIDFANSHAQECFPEAKLEGCPLTATPLSEMLSAQMFAAAFQKRQVAGSECRCRDRYWAVTVKVFGPSTQVESILLSFFDITPEKQMREQLSRKDKMESLGNLVAGIAHEIRTPLTSIKTFAELIETKYDNAAFRETFCRYVPQEVQRLNAIVSDLLDYAGQHKRFCSEVGVSELLRSIMPLFKGRLQEKPLELTVDVDEGLKVYADENQVKQVLINVILNAVEAQKDIAKAVVKVAARAADSYIKITVEDAGPGIEPQALRRIFDPFFTTKSGGTGLGLAISYQLIVENQGEIWARNMPQGGARLVIKLPMAPKGESRDEDINCG